MSNYWAVNGQIEKLPVLIQNQEADMARYREAHVFGKLYMLKGYWQCPLLVEAQEVFTISTPTGLFTPWVSHRRHSIPQIIVRLFLKTQL